MHESQMSILWSQPNIRGTGKKSILRGIWKKRKEKKLCISYPQGGGVLEGILKYTIYYKNNLILNEISFARY